VENLLQQLLNGVTWGSIYALIALGYTMVYGVLRLINFAHGEVYMMGAMSGYYTAHWLGFAGAPSLTGLVVVLVASMAVCGLLGALIERVAYRPLRGAGRLAACWISMRTCPSMRRGIPMRSVPSEVRHSIARTRRPARARWRSRTSSSRCS